MHTWEQFWYLTGFAIGSAMATSRTVVRRRSSYHADDPPSRPARHGDRERGEVAGANV